MKTRNSGWPTIGQFVLGTSQYDRIDAEELMILIWNGAGVLVFWIWLMSIFAGDYLAKALFGANASNGMHNITGEWLAASLTLGLALLLRKQRTAGVHPQTGEEIVLRPCHSLFFIPVIVWPAIFFVLGIVVYFK
jgi:hypothetical protein